MEQDIMEMLKAQSLLLEKIHVSVEKTRKYFFWTLVITLVVVVLPAIGLAFILPSFIGTITSGYGLY